MGYDVTNLERLISASVTVTLVSVAVLALRSPRVDPPPTPPRGIAIDMHGRPRAFLSAGERTVEGSGGLGCWADSDGSAVTCASGTAGYLGDVLEVQPGEALQLQFNRSDVPKTLAVVIDEQAPIVSLPANPAEFRAPIEGGRHYVDVSNAWRQGDTWHGFKIEVR